jgi:hypothetical protein
VDAWRKFLTLRLEAPAGTEGPELAHAIQSPLQFRVYCATKSSPHWRMENEVLNKYPVQPDPEKTIPAWKI